MGGFGGGWIDGGVCKRKKRKTVGGFNNLLVVERSF